MKKLKRPTQKEKVEVYEKYLHLLNMYCTVMNNDAVKKLVQNADRWSYAHRCGDMLSDKERQGNVDKAFWSLCDL